MANLKRTKPSIVKLMYQMMYDVNRILNANDIMYFAEGGTALGAVRNRGIIPWDDDLDIGIMNTDKKRFLELKKVLRKCGYSMVKTWFGYKIFLTKREKISGFDYSYPFLDVFFYRKLASGKVEKVLKAVRDEWPKEYYLKSELEPLQLLPFGDFQIPVANKPKKFFDRIFGKDWNTHGYREYDHEKEDVVVKKKVRLKKADKEPARPTSVKNRSCIGKESSQKPSLKSKIGIRSAKGSCDNKSAQGCNTRVAGKSIASFVINCDVHTKRISKFKKYAAAAGIKSCREVCVNGKAFTKELLCNMISHKLLSSKADMTPIEVAISLSHINVWQRFIDSCKDYALVFEDDVEMHKDFKKMLADTLKALNKANKKFDILFLWNGNWAESEEEMEEVLRVNKKIVVMEEKGDFNAGAVSYVISSKFAKRLLKNAYPMDIAIDIFIGEQSFEKRTRALSIEMKYNEAKECYISPFFRGTKWICGGEGGTGDTTQKYNVKKVKSLKCGSVRKVPSSRKRKTEPKTKCQRGKILNPDSGRCVNRDGVLGRKILGKSSRKRKTKTKTKCQRGKILNPDSGRCVNRDGVLGRKIRGK